MEPFAMHMIMELASIGDVAIQHKESTGNLVFTHTNPHPVPGVQPNAMVRFISGGSGFIISLHSILIRGTLTMFGLLLTASHVVYSIFDKKPYETEIYCKLENDNLRRAYLIKSLESDSSVNISAITGCEYCLPGDIAILLLQVDPSDKVGFYELSVDIRDNEKCFVSGYPAKPRKLAYAVPQYAYEPSDKILKIASQIFCDFNCLVYAEGNIEKSLNGLVEVSCSTTNGMSGSPIVYNQNVIGVYVGGPPLPGQRQSIQIIQGINQNQDIDSILNSISALQLYDHFYEEDIFSQICQSIFFQKAHVLYRTKNHLPVTVEEKVKFSLILADPLKFDFFLDQALYKIKILLLDTISSAVIYYKEKEKFQANIGISTTSIYFNGVFERLDRFRNLKNASDIIDIVNILA